jgi:hypothetical protein
LGSHTKKLNIYIYKIIFRRNLKNNRSEKNNAGMLIKWLGIG